MGEGCMSAGPANRDPKLPRSKQPSIVLGMHVNFACHCMQHTPSTLREGGLRLNKRHRIKGLVVNQKLDG
jgi:hypothetical protein